MCIQSRPQWKLPSDCDERCDLTISDHVASGELRRIRARSGSSAVPGNKIQVESRNKFPMHPRKSIAAEQLRRRANIDGIWTTAGTGSGRADSTPEAPGNSSRNAWYLHGEEMRSKGLAQTPRALLVAWCGGDSGSTLFSQCDGKSQRRRGILDAVAALLTHSVKRKSSTVHRTEESAALRGLQRCCETRRRGADT